ncbi:MAG: HD-GYP domain-containing protein [Erythrobacter sp.]
MQRRIACHDVKMGMFITGFGGSWFDHPFWRGQFLLDNANDVDRVKNANLPFVIIDIDKGIGPLDDKDGGHTDNAIVGIDDNSHDRWTDYNDFQSGWRRSSRPTPPRTDHQSREAARLLHRSKDTMRNVFDDARLGCAIHAPIITGVVEDVIDAITLESRVFLTVARLKNKDDYTYLHSVAVCALMVSVGRYLNLDKSFIRDLGMAGLLHDVGKMAVPDAILNKQGALSDDEFKVVRKHPEKGHQLLLESAGICDAALDVCRHHHERMDGTGYPDGLNDETLSFAARLGAICDIYDALTSNRAYKRAWTPHKAITEMSKWNGHLDRRILASFVQAIAMYPTGLLVTLSSNRLAILLGNDTGREKPFAIAFTDPEHVELNALEKVAIGKDPTSETIVSIEDADAYTINHWQELSAYAANGDWRSVGLTIA